MLYISNIVLEIYNIMDKIMQKIIIIFVVSILIIISVVFWTLNISFNTGEVLMISVIIILVGFALYLGISRVRSSIKKEPAEDELTKKIMTKASSYSFYISLYLWLFIMYMSDKTSLEAHSLMGAGIAGMALIFFLSWAALKIFGMKNE
ncbi:MAG: DUF2178 domain-containing protein [Ignavibacteriales bacterium]|nr:MAG: DUF2178 domain-containing protein [Ignavibacteriales bacterium]